MIGVSPDKIKPIEKFADKYKLTFPLASDETTRWRKIWHLGREIDVWPEVYGHGAQHVPGGRRGKIAKVWRKVSVTGHVADVLKAAQAL